MSLNNSRILAESGYFLEPIQPTSYGEEISEIQQVEDETQGLSDATDNGRGTYGIVLEQHRLLDMDGDGIEEPYVVWIDPSQRTLLRIQKNWEDGDKQKEATQYFTHYPFIQNPDGFYGLGMGHLIAKMNVAINKILRQSIDAGELANMGNMSGFISDALGAKGGDMQVTMGKFVKIPKSVENIRNAIYQMQFAGPNAVYVQLMEILIGRAERISSTTDAMTGDAQKVYQPLTIMTMLEQGLQLPTSIMEQMALAFEDELQKLYMLNKKYMVSMEIFNNGKKVEIITPEDYQLDMRVLPIIDPRNITQQQKIAKAQATYEFAINNPLISSNPEALREITRRVLEAMGEEDVEELLPPPPEASRIDDQAEENMLFLMPAATRPLFDVFPDQNHAEHIMVIDRFLQDPQNEPFISSMAPEDMQALMEHRKKHLAYLYGIKEGVGADGGQGRTDGMAGGLYNPQDGGLSLDQIQPEGSAFEMPIGQGGVLPGAAGGSGFAGVMDGGQDPGLGNIISDSFQAAEAYRG